VSVVSIIGLVVGFVDKIFGEEVGIESGTVVGVLSSTGCAVGSNVLVLPSCGDIDGATFIDFSSIRLLNSNIQVVPFMNNTYLFRCSRTDRTNHYRRLI